MTENEVLDNLEPSLFEAMPDALVVCNRRGQILLVNKKTETLFGYQRAELFQEPIEILMSERFRLNHAKHFKTYFENPKIRPMGGTQELYVIRKDGSEFPVMIHLCPLMTPDEVLGFECNPGT